MITEKHPVRFSVKNIDSIPRQNDLNGSDVQRYGVLAVILNDKEISLGEKYQVFLGEFTEGEIGKLQIKLQVNFYTPYLSGNATMDRNGVITREVRLKGEICSITCNMPVGQLPDLEGKNGYNLLVDITKSNIEKFQIPLEVEPVIIDLNSEKAKKEEEDRAECFQAFLRKALQNRGNGFGRG